MKNDVVGWWWSSKGHDTSKHLKPIFAEHSNSNICPTKEYAAKQHVAKLSSTTSLLSHSTLLCQQQQEQQQQKRTLATSSNNYSNITKTITNEKSFQCDISSSKHYNNNNNNNINYNDLYTVETVANLRRKTIKSAHCRPHYHHQHHHLYHHHHRQQRHHQHKHVYQRRGGGQGFAARSLCLQSLSVRLCSGDRKAYLMLLLQFTVVVLICSLNIGFVTCANVVKNQRQSTLSLYTDNDNLLDVLDYDDSGNSIGGDESDAIGHYTHTWAVHIPDGDKEDKVNAVARDHGFVNLGKIFGDHYHFAHHKVSKRSLVPALPHQSRLAKDKRVKWSQQQIAKSRQKRDFIRIRPSRTSSSRALSLVDAVPFSDPKWSQMWYLNRGGGLDMNVIPAWKEGITGKGIVVTILDDGLESDHPDIINNYDARASYDVNSHDEDPMPHYDLTDSNRHGTRCAGEVAATANNSICAVGIAFGASVGGVRMLDGDVTDAVEARSLSLNPQHIDIYSASWGPDDDGKTVDGPGELASRAFIEGVTKGRAGKGSIFIWASGNGGRELDNCNCDGYTNSIWTLSISSATEEGHVPWYSEKCSSTLATTYSSGGQAEKQVVTTDLHHSCTVSHTGTSASAPLAAGIAALVLESNQNLTWRDLQHIVVRTAKPANLKDTAWSKNGVGRRVSHSFGYGLMDAAAMVKVARSWKTVPEQQRCEINAPHVDKVIPPKSHITLQQTVKYCSINFLEHVQAKITLTSQRRGDIQLNLISPAGTKVTLLTPRMHDVSRSGFNQWPFMSVHTWGESPHGNWQLEIHNEGRYMAQITQWNLIFYGTELPAQPDDPIPVNSEHFSPYGNIMEHNDIEYDSSGQWHNMQQIGESSMMSHDRTNSSCLKATINRECLACAPPTFFFRGRCYDKCPSQTYVIKHNDMVDNISNIVTYQSKDDVDEELQSLERKRRYHYKTLKVNEFNIDRGETTTTENEGFFAPNIMLSCAACDVTCRQCYGPLNSQCNICFPGSQLRRIPYTNDSYCYMFAERSSGNNSHDNHSTVQQNKTNFNFLLPLLYLIPTFITISVIMLLIIYGWNNYLNKRNNSNGEMAATYAYDRVALISNEDDEVEAEMADNETDAGDDYHNQDEIDNKNVKKIVHKTVIKIYTDASEIL